MGLDFGVGPVPLPDTPLLDEVRVVLHAPSVESRRFTVSRQMISDMTPAEFKRQCLGLDAGFEGYVEIAHSLALNWGALGLQERVLWDAPHTMKTVLEILPSNRVPDRSLWQDHLWNLTIKQGFPT